MIARERATGKGDDIDAVRGLGAENPWLAWPLTIAMLALAGIPATAGFIGKFYLIDAAVDGGYLWLGVATVLGSAISPAHYLRVIAAMWMPESAGRHVSRAGDRGRLPGGRRRRQATSRRPSSRSCSPPRRSSFSIILTPPLQLSKDAARGPGCCNVAGATAAAAGRTRSCASRESA